MRLRRRLLRFPLNNPTVMAAAKHTALRRPFFNEHRQRESNLHRLSAALFGAFRLVVLALRQQSGVLRDEKSLEYFLPTDVKQFSRERIFVKVSKIAQQILTYLHEIFGCMGGNPPLENRCGFDPATLREGLSWH